jgi:hypothetical protein
VAALLNLDNAAEGTSMGAKRFYSEGLGWPVGRWQ